MFLPEKNLKRKKWNAVAGTATAAIANVMEIAASAAIVQVMRLVAASAGVPTIPARIAMTAAAVQEEVAADAETS